MCKDGPNEGQPPVAYCDKPSDIMPGCSCPQVYLIQGWEQPCRVVQGQTDLTNYCDNYKDNGKRCVSKDYPKGCSICGHYKYGNNAEACIKLDDDGITNKASTDRAICRTLKCEYYLLEM
jgi:hypothetical protein